MTQKSLTRVLRRARPMQRKETFESSRGEAACTVELLLRAVSAPCGAVHAPSMRPL